MSTVLFPYADLDEEVFMAPPQGMNIPEGYCLKLEKSLYGLKQAPRNCNQKSRQICVMNVGKQIV